MISQAVIPTWVVNSSNRAWKEFAVILGGSIYLAILAQVSIPLPFTPVPITGQTFGVATLALLWGSSRASATFALYLLEGALGLPVFAHLKTFAQVGPTTGYLVGMWVACFVVGKLADRGATCEFKRAFAACVVGSICVFTFGLIGLSFFASSESLFTEGLFPFLPGDLIKSVTAATLASGIARRSK